MFLWITEVVRFDWEEWRLVHVWASMLNSQLTRWVTNEVKLVTNEVKLVCVLVGNK